MTHPSEDKRPERHICLEMGPPYDGRVFDFDVRTIVALCHLGRPDVCALITIKNKKTLNVRMPYAEVYKMIYERDYVEPKKSEQKFDPVPPPKRQMGFRELEMLRVALSTPIVYQATLPGFEECTDHLHRKRRYR